MGDGVKSSSLADAESSGKEKPLADAESSGKEKPLAHAESNGKEKHVRPDDIEKTSMEIIDDELRMRGIVIPKENYSVTRRVIHTTADFDYAVNLAFTDRAAEQGIAAFARGISIVTDTNMTLAGISRPAMERLGVNAHCFMAEPRIREMAREMGTTRAAASQIYAAGKMPGAVLSVGNAPTALFEIARLIRNGLRPALVIGVPVGFVNVIESKEEILSVCREYAIPAIAARGRKGGSTVACAILNALLYEASGLDDPSARS
jgi:precorrin-8X/cobalt-precorrin-8 methylmutase